MATNYEIVGVGPNRETLVEAWLYESGGASLNLLRVVSGDIVITPPTTEIVEDKPADRTVSTHAGKETAGSIDIPMNARELTRTVSMGDLERSAFDVLWQNTSNGFTPYTEALMSGFDGDTAGEMVLFTPREKVWRIELVWQPNRGGSPRSQRGTVLSVYAGCPSPPVTAANVGGISTLTLKGTIRRAGCITLTNI